MNKAQLDADRAFLVQKFPFCFVPKGEPKRPLKVGIHVDMQRLGVLPTSKRIKAFLGDYTRGPIYLEAVAAGGPRYGLEGKIAGQVDEAARRKAVTMLGQIRKDSADRAELRVLRTAMHKLEREITREPFRPEALPSLRVVLAAIVSEAGRQIARIALAANPNDAGDEASIAMRETEAGLSGGARAARPPAAPVVLHEREASF